MTLSTKSAKKLDENLHRVTRRQFLVRNDRIGGRRQPAARQERPDQQPGRDQDCRCRVPGQEIEARNYRHPGKAVFHR